MTMGAWFRTYLFYPLSVSKFMLNISSKSRKKLGNAWGKRVPLYISTLTIWFCTGFWHGASWNYIAWGLSNGVIILISKELEPLYAKFHKKFPKAKENKGFIAFTVFRTFWLMCVSFVLLTVITPFQRRFLCKFQYSLILVGNSFWKKD